VGSVDRKRGAQGRQKGHTERREREKEKAACWRTEPISFFISSTIPDQLRKEERGLPVSIKDKRKVAQRKGKKDKKEKNKKKKLMGSFKGERERILKALIRQTAAARSH